METFVEWGYLGLFFASFLAATIIPLGSEIVLSLLIYKGYDLSISLFVASLGNWAGGMSSYYLGRLGNFIMLKKYFKIDKSKILNFQDKIKKWGSSLAFFCWLPILGDPIAISLGFFKINYKIVAIWMLIGKVFRYLIWAFFTYWGLSFLNF